MKPKVKLLTKCKKKGLFEAKVSAADGVEVYVYFWKTSHMECHAAFDYYVGHVEINYDGAESRTVLDYKNLKKHSVKHKLPRFDDDEGKIARKKLIKNGLIAI